MDITQVLIFKYPGTEWRVNETYESLEWLDKEVEKPTFEELQQAWDQYLLEKERNKYKELRAAAYPAIQDQLDLIYHNGIEGWAKHILNVKKKYPNPAKKTEERTLMSNFQVHDEITALNAKIDALEKKISTTQHSSYVEMGDIKNAMCAIKGFMMEIPNIQKTLGDIQSQLDKSTREQ